MLQKFVISIIIFTLLLGMLFYLTRNKDWEYLSKNNNKMLSTRWEQDETGWKSIDNPPPCPEPLQFDSITDTTKATSVLYPGQMRSVGYENTAGFRFDGLPNDAITIKAPIDGEIVRAARFLVNGELQYVIDILSPCGIMNRFDHILILSDKLQQMANSLPEPKENDNRSASVTPPIQVSRGEILATAVGLTKNNNTFLSWTVFDFRKKNDISQNPTWAKEHPVMDHYAICPFPYLPRQDQERINSLPAADSLSGSKSDFCKFVVR